MLSITKARNYMVNARYSLNADGWRCGDIFLGSGHSKRVAHDHPDFKWSDRGQFFYISEYPSWTARNSKTGARVYVKGISDHAVQVLYNEHDLARALNVESIPWQSIHAAIENYEAIANTEVA